MNTRFRTLPRSIIVKVIIPAVLLLLPLLAGGAAPGANTAVASAPVPATSSASSDAAAEKYTYLVMRVYFNNLTQRDELAQELSPEEVSTTSGFLTVIRDKAAYDSLKARGIRVEIDLDRTATLNNPIAAIPDTFYGGYKTVEEIYAFLDQEVAAHPTLAAKIDIGDSWCKTHPGTCLLPTASNGYDLFALHVTNQAISGPKPVFVADGGIHAREIATPEVVMRLITWLLDNYDTNADAHWMVDYQDIWLIPTINPDGHHIVEAGGANPYYQRKNGDNVGGSGCQQPPNEFDQSGVDNNRNFPFKWDCCGGSSSDPCDQTYHGTGGNSEDENQAIVGLIRSLVPDQRGPLDTDTAPITTTGVYQNIHSNSAQNLYTWGWTNDNAPNYSETRNIAAHMSAVNAGGNGYFYGSIYGGLYPVDGGSIDWAYGELGMAAVSTEVDGNDFLINYSCMDNPGCGSTRGIWPENKGQLIYLGKIASTPYLTSHGPDTNLDSSTPITSSQGTMQVVTSTITFAWTGNSFSQNVGAAEYYLDTPPAAGGTANPMTASDGSFNSPTEGVQATIDTSSLSLGRHIVFIRGRGATDFSGYQTWGPLSAVFLDVTPAGSGTPTPIPTATGLATNTPTATSTASPTSIEDPTAIVPTDTPVATDTAVATDTSVPATETVVGTPTVCTIQFTDVLPGSTFYSYIQCMACQGIISGYPCSGPGEPCDGNNNPYYRPQSNVTRGQVAKIVSNAAGYTDTPNGQEFEDVAVGSTFYDFIYRLFSRGLINGYACGGAGEPCGPSSLPYFRPSGTASRGQLAKIDALAAGYTDPGGAQQYEDVTITSTFYDFIWQLTDRGLVTGYPCGGPGEPCVGPDNLPYFRPVTNVTRAQTAKIVSSTFFPECSAGAKAK